MGEFICILLISVFLATLILLLFLSAKNNNTCKNQLIIATAIFVYQNDCIRKKKYENIHKVDFDDMEDYDKTLFRLWDWGYKRILPKDKFELVKPFIERAKDESKNIY